MASRVRGAGVRALTLPWGAICYAVATACAAAVARRDRGHAPIVDTLGAAALHAAAAPHLEPRHALALWLAVPATAGVTYLRAFDVPAARLAWGGVSVALAAVALWAPRARMWWETVTWAPLGTAAALGIIAGVVMVPRADTLTKRIAWALIASDVFTLICHWKWPDVQPIQGKAAAIGIAVLHVPEIMARGSRRPDA